MRSRKLHAVALLGLVLVACNELLGNDPGTPVDAPCEWLGDECNCYRRFAAGVANNESWPSYIPGEQKCGVVLDSANNVIDPTTGGVMKDAQKPTYGVFLERDKLDVCILTGPYQSGQVVFDPPLSITSFPPSGFSFQIIDRFGSPCSVGSFNSTMNFSIGFPGPQGTGGTGDGGAQDNGGDAAESQCLATMDPRKDRIAAGAFSMTTDGSTEAATVACPNGEVHKFSLSHLDKCDGSDPGEDTYNALLPRAAVEASPGDAGGAGFVRFRVFWPPTAAGIDLDGQESIAVEYFHCMIPPKHCFDNGFGAGETDVDCGGVCMLACDDGKRCLVDADCASKMCRTDGAGMLKCAPLQCGDRQVGGIETCDDGNTNGGDGCSAICEQEPGYICQGPGKCQDIDECALGTDNCPVGSTKCKNLPGTFICECDAGTSRDGRQCVLGCGDGDKQPPEECDDGNLVPGDGCTEHCVTEAGFFCMGEGPSSCVDIDECAAMLDNCLATETCKNVPGSFACICPENNVAQTCNGTCIDVSKDEFNCGNCGNECLPNQICVGSMCM